MKQKIVFFGTPDFVIPVLQSVYDHFDLVGVVTAPDTIQGRKKVLTPSPIKQFTLLHYPKLPVLTPLQFNSETIQQLYNLKPTLFIVAAYGKIIPQSILDIPKYGSINIHPSLLPKYRGTSPIQNAILNGDDTTGVTVIKMDARMDHGPILAQWEKPITPEDTFGSLHEALFKEAAEKLPEIISQYVSGEITPQPQDDTQATYCDKITKEDGYFSLDNPPDPVTLDRMIRAYYPWPTAWTKLQMANGKSQIVKFLPERKVQVEGKNVVTVKEFLNGYPELRGEIQKLLGE